MIILQVYNNKRVNIIIVGGGDGAQLHHRRAGPRMALVV
jgi:hypothetical protein